MNFYTTNTNRAIGRDLHAIPLTISSFHILPGLSFLTILPVGAI